MDKKTLKKLTPIIKEADNLKNKKNYKEAVRKYREGITYLRVKAAGMEDREVEVSNIIAKINQTHSAEINDVIDQTMQLVEKKELDEAIKKLKYAIDVANNIEDATLKDSEISKIKYEISKIEVKILIEEGKKLKDDQEFDKAIEIFQKALKDADKIDSSKQEIVIIINNIKNQINQTYSDKIKIRADQGNQSKKSEKFEEAIKTYENAMQLAEKMYDSDLKESEISNIKDLINETHSKKIEPLLTSAKELIEKNNSEEAINTLKEAIEIGNKMFDSNQKNTDFNAIGELINPLLVENIKSIKEKGILITEEKNYEESVPKVNEAAVIFNKALDIAKEMVDSEEKNNQLDQIINLIDKTCSAGIKVRKDAEVQFIEQKEYEKATSEMYSAMSIAKYMVYDESENVELEDIKKRINHIYSAQIDDILDKGKDLLNQKKFDDATKIFNEAKSISNKMYVSDEMEREIAKIKNLLYQAEMKGVVATGYVSEEQKKYEQKLEDLTKELDRANTITDAERRRKKIEDVKHDIDIVYSNLIKLVIEQSLVKGDQNDFDGAGKEIENALKLTDVIEYSAVRDEELKKIISTVTGFGNLLAKQNKFDDAYTQYDTSLDITERIKDNDIQTEEIRKIKLRYEQELDNKVKQDINNGKFDIAVEYCQKAINLDNSYVESYVNLGNAFIKKEEYDKAIEQFDKAIKLDPDHVGALSDRGLAFELKNDYDNALKSLDEALEKNPEYALAWYRKGNVFKEKNQSNEAIESYKKATDLKPDYAKAWLLEGRVYFDDNEYHKALEYIEKAIQLDSEISKEVNPLINDFKNIVNSIQEKLSNFFKNKKES
ncbi:MAG: tetratricopeptide repeat protein [Promethearchaeota archaeon]|nr:MAG: tetratricopeptide repeat protein [Candidatus Lokiarchaeota archaeon]